MAKKAKWGKIGPPHSAKRKAHMRRIAKLGRSAGRTWPEGYKFGDPSRLARKKKRRK